MGRDNISGSSGGLIKTIFLFPGKVIQWIMYMFVSGKKFGGIVQQTRFARSPIITYFISIIVWGLLLYFFKLETIIWNLLSRIINILS